MRVEDVLQEVILRLADIIIQGGSNPNKIIVSKKVYELLMGITVMPRSVQYIDGVFYIADIPVEVGELDDERDNGVWFRIA